MSDFFYIFVGKKLFVYFCVILDLFFRKIIVWIVSKNIDIILVIIILEKVI